MEYFLPLSVMAMIISSISIFLIDYKNPVTSTEAKNNQPPSNQSDKMDNSADEFAVSEKQDNVNREKNLDKNSITKLNSLQKNQSITFSFLWNLSPQKKLSVINL